MKDVLKLATNRQNVMKSESTRVSEKRKIYYPNYEKQLTLFSVPYVQLLSY